MGVMALCPRCVAEHGPEVAARVDRLLTTPRRQAKPWILFPFTFRTDDAHMKDYDGLPVRITELLSRTPDRPPNDGLFRVATPGGIVFNAESYELHQDGERVE